MTVKHYPSPLGILILIASDGKLVYCNWQHPDCLRKLNKLKRLLPEEESPDDEGVLDETSRQLDEYFAGRLRDFNLPIGFVYGSEFQQLVWKALQGIPYGGVISYTGIGQIIGKPGACRSIAGACGDNPLAVVIPCHRAIYASGALGGYTGGIEKKNALLELEKLKE